MRKLLRCPRTLLDGWTLVDNPIMPYVNCMTTFEPPICTPNQIANHMSAWCSVCEFVPPTPTLACGLSHEQTTNTQYLISSVLLCYIYDVPDMDVSKNRGTPKSSILIGFSIIKFIHFGIPLFLETPIWEWFSFIPPIHNIGTTCDSLISTKNLDLHPTQSQSSPGFIYFLGIRGIL